MAEKTAPPEVLSPEVARDREIRSLLADSAVDPPAFGVARKIGRPTKYRGEESDADAEAILAEGLGIASVAAALNVTIPTVYDLAKKHPSFSKALARGLAASEAYYERLVRDNLGNKDFNVKLFRLLAVNRFGWTTKLDASVSFSAKRVEIEASPNLDLTKLPVEELVKLRGILRSASPERTTDADESGLKLVG